MGLTGNISEINDFGWKSQIFPTPCVFCATPKGVPLGIGYWRWGIKKL